jgi:hypothetical protein
LTAEQERAAAELAAALASVEQHEGALGLLDAAVTAAEDRTVHDASDAAARGVVKAREARALAEIKRDGAVRRVEAARVAVHEAALQDAREQLAAALPRADRGALFDRLVTSITTIATVDAAPPVAIYEGTYEELDVRMADDARRRLARAMACREIRRAVEDSAAAVATIATASAVLGVKHRAAAVPEAHVFAAAALECHAMTATAIDVPWWDRWLTGLHPLGHMYGPTLLATMRATCGMDLYAWIAAGRAIYRSGDASRGAL